MKCEAEHHFSGKSLTLQSANVSVPPGKALTIQPSAIVNLNGHYLKSSGGTIADNGATWSPDIAVSRGQYDKGVLLRHQCRLKWQDGLCGVWHPQRAGLDERRCRSHRRSGWKHHHQWRLQRRAVTFNNADAKLAVSH